MEALTSALNLTVFGMGFVFSFLVLLVFIMKLLSKVANSTISTVNSEPMSASNTTASALNGKHNIDEETKFVIKEAIKMHRGA